MLRFSIFSTWRTFEIGTVNSICSFIGFDVYRVQFFINIFFFVLIDQLITIWREAWTFYRHCRRSGLLPRSRFGVDNNVCCLKWRHQTATTAGSIGRFLERNWNVVLWIVVKSVIGSFLIAESHKGSRKCILSRITTGVHTELGGWIRST